MVGQCNLNQCFTDEQTRHHPIIVAKINWGPRRNLRILISQCVYEDEKAFASEYSYSLVCGLQNAGIVGFPLILYLRLFSNKFATLSHSHEVHGCRPASISQYN
jgi:hypothetical protein